MEGGRDLLGDIMTTVVDGWSVQKHMILYTTMLALVIEGTP